MSEKPIVPTAADVETTTINVRFERRLLPRLDAVSAATGQKRGTVIAYILEWGLDEIERRGSAATKKR